ncbi:MAG TPA: hypothetical protein VIN59_05570 [Alphaproteobacteria bacterium]
MAAPRKLIHVWIEGLYEQDQDFGLAWVVKDDKLGMIGSKLRLPFDMTGFENFGTECAEFMAIVYALKSLPAKSAVVIHSGSNNLIRWMELAGEGQVLAQQKKYLSAPPFKKAFEAALAECEKALTYSFDYVRKNNEGMEMARDLAEQALYPDDDA